MINLQSTVADETHRLATAFVDGLGEPIRLDIAFCESYSALLQGDHGDPVEVDALLELANRRGRIILAGRGASGKSAALNRVALRAAETGAAPFLMRLSRWDQEASSEWLVVRENALEAMDFLMRRFGATGHDITDAEFLPPDVSKLFIIDGLNETPGSVADEILHVCDQIAALVIGAAVVVSDRLIRRSLPEKRWQFAMPLPIEASEIKRLVKENDIPLGAKNLLSSPFFLDRAIRGELKASPLATIRELFETRGHLNEEGQAIATRAAFNAYERDRSRTFPRVRLIEIGGEEVLNTLCAGGLLVPADDSHVAFSHHWYHDYLASKYVVEQPALWVFEERHRVFDILTFKANSFDAIAFALELLPTVESGKFLEAVYDWNPYAAGYALAEADLNQDDVPSDVRFIVMAMLAERRFDRQFYSARRALDALDLQRDAVAQKMRSTSNLSELSELVEASTFSTKEFEAWRQLFTAKRPISDMIRELALENPVLGWTSANVLRRFALTEEDRKVLLSMISDSRAVVRWRVVHVMGASPSDDFIKALFARLHDADSNVRYGAIRSIVEVASRDETRIPYVVETLTSYLPSIRSDDRVLGELERAVFLSSGFAPQVWSQEISRIFYALLEQEEDARGTERWSKIAYRLRVHHRPVEKRSEHNVIA